MTDQLHSEPIVEPANNPSRPETQPGPIAPDAVSADQAVSRGGLLAWIRSHKKTSAGIGAGVAVLSASAAIVASSMRGPSEGTPTPAATSTSETTAPPSGTPTAAPTETQVPVPETYQFNIDKATVDKYLSESQDAFLGLPVEQRVLVSLYYAQNMPKFAADWYAVSQNPLDQLPPAITMNMTNQQIVTFNGYLHRIPNTIPDPTDPNGYKMDVNAAHKMIAGNFVDASTSQNYVGFAKEADQFANDGGSVPSARTLAVSSGAYFAASVVDPTGSSETLTDSRGSYRTIRVLESDGTTPTLTYRWINLGNNSGVWLQQN